MVDNYNVSTNSIRKRFGILLVALLSIISFTTAVSYPAAAQAKYDETFYSNNKILFYDPRDTTCEGSGGTVGTILSGDSIEEKVWNFFVEKGLTAEQTAGVMGNISHESGFNPAAIEGGNSIGFGIVQWSFGRRTALEAAAAQAGKSPSDLSFQLDYLYMELNTRGVDYSKYQGKGYTSEWDGLTKQKTVEEAVIFFHHEFEISYLINFDKPGYKAPFHNRTYPSADAAVIGERGGLKGPTGHPGAQHYFDTFSGSTGGGGEGCSAGVGADATFDVSKVYEPSTDIKCAAGTNPLGEETAYMNGTPFQINICEIPNSIEEGKGGKGAVVNSRVSGAVLKMFKDMAAEFGIEKIPINSSFRTPADQQRAWDTYGSPQAARPGYSNHQSGVAIDFGEGGCGYKAGITSCPNSRIWNWLVANSASYQFQQLPNEWWHWSPNGK